MAETGSSIAAAASADSAGGVPAVAVDHLSVAYGGEPAIEGISFSAPPGAFVGLIGPNGSGKSTILKSLIGLLTPSAGSARVFGRPPAEVRTRVGYMPQSETIDWSFPISVREVVAMGRYRPAWGPRRLLRRLDGPAVEVDAALERMRISTLADRQIADLSGGEQRRVLVARTLVRDPDLLLLDEPAAGLDAPTEELLMELFGELTAAGKTVIVATHDITAVYEHFSLACCVNRRLVAAGPPQEVMTEDVLVRTFGHQLVVFHRGVHGYTAEPHVVHGQHEHE